MKGSRQSVLPKKKIGPPDQLINLTNQSSNGELQDPLNSPAPTKTNARNPNTKRLSSNVLNTPINSTTLQNDLIRMFKSGLPHKQSNISQQYFYHPGKAVKTETSDHSDAPIAEVLSLSPSTKGYLKKQWLATPPSSHTPTVSPTMKEHRHTPASLASTELDPRSVYKSKLEDSRIIVWLHLNEQKIQLNIDPRLNATHQLEQMLRQVVLEHNPNQLAVSFVSVDKDLQIDYFLQCPGRRLNELRYKVLNLQPNIPAITSKPSTVGLKDFLFIKCIGVGGFSRVYLVKLITTGRFYAMKLIDKEFILKRKTECIVRNERDIMAVVDHPFLVRLEYSFEHRNFLVFVLEYCSGGELFQQLKRFKRMTEAQARFYFSEVCLGMLFLHQLNICYRDIKPENILLDYEGHVRIADFGLSKPNMGDRDVAYSFCGSPEYMAPEMLRKEGHTIAVDHYCLGVLLYELVTGLPPFYSKDIDKIYDAILRDPITFPPDVHMSIELKDLLTKLLIKDPRARLGSKTGVVEILNHPWFSDISLKNVLERKVTPPVVPDPLRFNFQITEAQRNTEMNTIDKLLGRRGLQTDIKIFSDFYFDRNKELQIQQEQMVFYQHYKQMVEGLHVVTAKEQKGYLIESSKCSSKGRLVSISPQTKSPAVFGALLSPGKRFTPKHTVSASNKALKKMVQNVFLSDRNKGPNQGLKRNHSYQFDSFLQASKLLKVNKTSLDKVHYRKDTSKAD